MFTGFKYRQCFAGGRPDFARYDSLFYEAGVQEFPETVLPLIFDRLLYPMALKEEAKQQYLDYIREEPERFARWCFDMERARQGGREMAGGSGPGAGTFSGAAAHGIGILRPDPLELISCLNREGLLDRSMLEICLRSAAQAQDSRAVSYLEEVRGRMRAGRHPARKYVL